MANEIKWENKQKKIGKLKRKRGVSLNERKKKDSNSNIFRCDDGLWKAWLVSWLLSKFSNNKKKW